MAPSHQESGQMEVVDNQNKKSKEKPQKQKQYAPGYRTGAYALLLTLYKDSQKPESLGYMTKDELQKRAQSLSDKSFTLPDPGSRYTAWSSMGTLIKKGLIIKTSNPAKYSITPAGSSLAERLNAVGDGEISSSPVAVPCVLTGQACFSTSNESQSHCTSANNINVIAALGQSPDKKFNVEIDTCSVESSPTLQTSQSLTGRKTEFKPEYILKPGSFDIILCVDFIETTGGTGRSRKDILAPEITKNGVEFDVRKLQVGDFLWIAREKCYPVPGEFTVPERKELVLDYIIERKRMDDLNSSIIDGRFREQKFRLVNCGLRHPIYLVEDFGSAQHLSLPEATLKQAIVNTQVIDGLFVKRTHDIKESVAYLTLMTRFIQRFYLDKTLIACPREEIERVNDKKGDIYLMTFQEFSKETTKNKVLTVSEMFGKQLMQMSGMSADKASAVLAIYPTPRSLFEAYDSQPTTEQKETMLSSLKYGKLNRKFGPALSKLVFQLYCTKGSLS